MTTTFGEEPNELNQFHYTFNDDFVLTFTYFDLSDYVPPILIDVCLVEMGPLAVTADKEVFTTPDGSNFIRIMSREVVWGNYTVVVNLTNQAFVERTFFININLEPPPDITPPAPNQVIQLEFNETKHLESCSMDAYGFVTINYA